MNHSYQKALNLFLVLSFTYFIACGGSESDPYQDLLDNGWLEFENKNYSIAYDKFSEAILLDETKAEAYTGQGWSMMRRDSLMASKAAFQKGLEKTDANADLYAGLAFVLHALNDNTSSNNAASQAILLSDSDWLFSHDTKLDIEELWILEAENFFALGNFNASLIRVQIISTDFTADVSTAEGQRKLADEIERLRSL